MNLYVEMVARVNLKFHGGGIVHIILTLWRLQVILKFYGGGNFHITLTLWRRQVSLKFHGWEFSYYFNLVETPSKFEVP